MLQVHSIFNQVQGVSESQDSGKLSVCVRGQGWEWVEDSWQVDMSLLAEEAVDEDGWAYAVDFRGWEWPPKPGAGKFRKVTRHITFSRIMTSFSSLCSGFASRHNGSMSSLHPHAINMQAHWQRKSLLSLASLFANGAYLRSGRHWSIAALVSVCTRSRSWQFNLHLLH